MNKYIVYGGILVAIVISIIALVKPQGKFGAAVAPTVADCTQNTCLTSLGVQGDLTVDAQFAVGSSTPSVSDISANNTSTSSLALFSSGTGKGGCLQVQGNDGVSYRMYITSGDYSTTTGNGRSGKIAIWETGACR